MKSRPIKMKPILVAIIAIPLVWSTLPRTMGQSPKLDEVRQLLKNRNHEKALEKALANLKELKSSPPEGDPTHPSIGFAAGVAGQAAHRAGDYKAAVSLFREGLPLIANMRENRLLNDEFMIWGGYIDSLVHLGLRDAALEELRDLLKRTREGLALRKKALNLNLIEDGQEVTLESMFPSEDQSVFLLEKIGTLHLEGENWADAEDALKSAEKLLKDLHPEKQAELAELREGWEEAARKQGKAIRPQRVGRFSNPRMLLFEGVESIDPEEIYSALSYSSRFVLASHPAAELDAFLRELEGCLILGYQATGFPDVEVKADWSDVEESVVVRIKEGPRFKAGDLQITGANVLPEERLRELLILKEEIEPAPLSRAEAFYQAMLARKTLPPDRVKEELQKVFPESFPDDNAKQDTVDLATLDPLLLMGADLGLGESTENPGFWEEGKWVDYRPETLRKAESAVRAFYQEERRFLARFEVKWAPRPEIGVVDLVVEVDDEGAPARLGVWHVAGQRINSEEDLAEYLELEKGMALSGDFVGEIQRKLYESARFLGWEVTPRLSLKKRGPNQVLEIDLLVHVEEHWMAPPLSSPWSREQKAMLNFARWLNHKAGVEEDMVLSGSADTDNGPLSVKVALGSGRLSLSADGPNYQIHVVGKREAMAKMVIGAGENPLFRAEFPVPTTGLKGSLVTYQHGNVDPYNLKISGFEVFGSAVNNSTEPSKFVAGMDLATAMRMGSDLCEFQDNGDVVLTTGSVGPRGTLRFHEASGRLISWKMDGAVLQAEKGAVERIEKELTTRSQDLPNWLDGKRTFSLLFLGMGFAAELLRDDNFGAAGLTDEVTARLRERMKRWTPVASVLGDVAGTLSDKLDAAIASSQETSFTIPLTAPELGSQQLGQITSMFLAMGGYDMLSRYLEPGTWPDLVAREVLFFLDGKPYYIHDTIQKLLDDDSMGPLGCLLCARLLQQQSAWNPAAADQFITKARKELNRDGFAKDWTLALGGNAGEDGFGWKTLKSLGRLTDEQIASVFPAEIAGTVLDFMNSIREIGDNTDAAALAPVMDRLWDNGLDEIFTEKVDEAKESLTPKVDRKLVAAVVDSDLDHPVLRGAIKLQEQLFRKGVPNPLRWSSVDACVNDLLFARALWRTGRGATPQAAIQQAEMMVTNFFGPNGWKQIETMGLKKEELQKWVGIQMASRAQVALVLNKEIDEKELRAFYDRNKAFSKARDEVQVYLLRHSIVIAGQAEREQAIGIQKRVKDAGNIEAMIDAFKAERGVNEWRLTSTTLEQLGHHLPQVAKQIAKVPDGQLSDPFTAKIGSARCVCLALVSHQHVRPPAFENVREELQPLAILDREITRLREQAHIVTYEEPAEEEAAEEQLALEKAETDKRSANGLMRLLGNPNLGAGDDSLETKKTEGKNEGLSLLSLAQKESGEGSAKQLYDNLLELTRKESGEVSAKYLVDMGAYAELDLLGPKESGMESAIDYYLRAAAGGEVKAMLRLAELYRIGRGVEQDKAETKKWRERATTAQ